MGYKTSHGADTRQQIYDWMKAYKAEHGYMPTIKEVAEGTGLWRNGIVWHLEKLRRRGQGQVRGRQDGPDAEVPVKTTVQAGTTMRVGNVKVKITRHASTTSRRVSGQIAAEKVDSVVRVRLSRVVEHKGAYNGEPFIQITSEYLDGGTVEHISAGTYNQQKVTPMTTVIPARTKDAMEFGRLSVAAKALASSMSKYGADNEPSPEQVTTFLMGYQNLLEASVARRGRG